MSVQDNTSFETLLKEQYLGAVNSQINNSNLLLSELSVNKDVAANAAGGLHAVIALKVGRNKGAGPRADMATLPEPGRTRNKRALIDLTYQYVVGGLSGPVAAKAADSKRAFVSALTHEIEGMTEAAEHIMARQVWGRQSGDIAAITVVTGAGTNVSPYVITVDSNRITQSDFLEEEELITFGAVTSGVATVEPGVCKIVEVDPDAGTIQAVVYSGTPAPTVGDKIFSEGTENECLAGIEQAIADRTSTFEGVDRSAERRFRSVTQAQGGAITFDGYERLRNKIKTASGKAPNLVVSSYSTERALFLELQDQIRYSDATDLTRGSGVRLPGDGTPKLKATHQAKRGSLFAVNTKDLQWISTSNGFEFDTEGGGMRKQTARKDATELWLKRYVQLGYTALNSHGELTGITEDSSGY